MPLKDQKFVPRLQPYSQNLLAYSNKKLRDHWQFHEMNHPFLLIFSKRSLNSAAYFKADVDIKRQLKSRAISINSLAESTLSAIGLSRKVGIPRSKKDVQIDIA